MAAATAEIAVVAKLKEGTPLASGRINPITNTPGAPLPFVTVTRAGNAPANRLGGRAALLATTVEIGCYAATQAEAVALAASVRARLAPAGAPWTNAADGVQGCFYQDGSGDEVLNDPAQDTPRVVRETYLVWHYPT